MIWISSPNKFIVVWLNEKEKFAELFDDSGLDRRKFHQKKNFQEIASFWLWLESWHLQLKCVLPHQWPKYNKGYKITKAIDKFFCDCEAIALQLKDPFLSLMNVSISLYDNMHQVSGKPWPCQKGILKTLLTQSHEKIWNWFKLCRKKANKS